MKDDVVKGIDEAINNLKHEQEDGDKDIEELVEVESLSLEKDHSVSTSDTIKLDKIDEETIEESVENKEEVTEEKT